MAKAEEKWQSRTGSVWIDDALGIMRFDYAPGSVCTLAEAKENVEIQRKLLDGRRMSILIDVRQAKSVDREARMYYASIDDFTAMALFGGTPVGNVIANFFIAVYGSRGIPTKLFAKEDDAIAWLKDLAQ
jgi:hypothetical protein